MTAKEVFLIVLLVLTFFVSTARAEDCDVDGAQDQTWTIYVDGRIIHTRGSICVFNSDAGTWEARGIDGNKVYFGGTYLIRYRHHKDNTSDVTVITEDSGERIDW